MPSRRIIMLDVSQKIFILKLFADWIDFWLQKLIFNLWHPKF